MTDQEAKGVVADVLDRLRPVITQVTAFAARDAHMLGHKTAYDVGRVIVHALDAFLEKQAAMCREEAGQRAAELPATQ